MQTEKIVFDHSVPKELLIKLSGDWREAQGRVPAKELAARIKSHPEIAVIIISVSGDLLWDSGLISFLLKLFRECERKNIRLVREGLPPGAQKILALALRVHKENIPPRKPSGTFFARYGDKVLASVESLRRALEFLGEIAVSLGRLITGRSRFHGDDLMLILERSGVDTLPLVCLISLLVGMILAFVGSIQLKMFGAQIYIANIVGISMVRELSAVMTGIVLSGRIGASFAAELGMMQTNEEIDALKTLGVSPVEYLVVPRILALVVMMPLLTVYADLMGVLGGYLVSVGMLGINPVEYLSHTRLAVKFSYVWIGLIHSFVFGAIIAFSGCLSGINCERTASGVGVAATGAVVAGITGIVIATAVITFICQVIGV
ncbi:MAG: ABC transporter permease [Candidatus Omnitrophica bacterium]|nr:ABC transporter permease [Candidatus Omnitrophota bacterium]